MIRGMLEDSWTVAKAYRPDAIVAHQKTLAAPHVAEKLGIPHVQALTVPMLRRPARFRCPAWSTETLVECSIAPATDFSAS